MLRGPVTGSRMLTVAMAMYLALRKRIYQQCEENGNRETGEREEAAV